MTSAKRLAETIVSYLRARGELSLLPEVVKSLEGAARAARAGTRVTVTSAYKLSAPELKDLETYVMRTMGGTYPIENVVDPSLVAGFTLQMGDTFIDASTRGRLEALSSELAK